MEHWAGKAQLARYGGDDGVEVKRGVFGTSGSTRVGIMVFDWQEDPEVDGLYTYKLNEWDLSALLAAMERRSHKSKEPVDGSGDGQRFGGVAGADS